MVYDHVEVFKKGPSSQGRSFHRFESAYRRLKIRRMLSRGNMSTQTNTLLTFVRPYHHESNWSDIPFNVFGTYKRQRNYGEEWFARNGQAFSSALIFVVHA